MKASLNLRKALWRKGRCAYCRAGLLRCLRRVVAARTEVSDVPRIEWSNSNVIDSYSCSLAAAYFERAVKQCVLAEKSRTGILSQPPTITGERFRG